MVPCLHQDGTVPFLIIVFIIGKLWHHNFPVFSSCGNSVHGVARD